MTHKPAAQDHDADLGMKQDTNDGKGVKTMTSVRDGIQNAIEENFSHLVSCGWGRSESILAVAAKFGRTENDVSEIVKNRG